jgi:hypothetical protein
MLDKPTDEHLLVLARHVIKNLKVSVQPADTYVSLPFDLTVGDVLAILDLVGSRAADRTYAWECLKELGGFFTKVRVGLPKKWSDCHSHECGTAYRGCAPNCPKDVWERTGLWIGAEESKPDKDTLDGGTP